MNVMTLAIQELRARDSMFGEQYKLTASLADHEWVFWFVFLPEAFGRDVTVFVKENQQTRILVGI